MVFIDILVKSGVYVVCLLVFIGGLFSIYKNRLRYCMLERIKINKYSAMIIWIRAFITFYLYAQQLKYTKIGLSSLNTLCQILYVIKEMCDMGLIANGMTKILHIQEIVSARVPMSFSSKKKFLFRYVLPFIITSTWGVVSFVYENENNLACWYGVTFTNNYWIIRGSRLAMIAIDFIALIRIFYGVSIILWYHDVAELKSIRKFVIFSFTFILIIFLSNMFYILEEIVKIEKKFVMLFYITYRIITLFDLIVPSIFWCNMTAKMFSAYAEMYWNRPRGTRGGNGSSGTRRHQLPHDEIEITSESIPLGPIGQRLARARSISPVPIVHRQLSRVRSISSEPIEHRQLSRVRSISSEPIEHRQLSRVRCLNTRTDED